MFETIGTMGSYLQQYQLKKSAQQKIETGTAFDWKDSAKSAARKLQDMRTAADSAQKSIVQLSLEKAEKDTDQAAETRKSTIKQKLRQGKKLSAEELSFLRRHDEELYKKARTTMEEREHLERALKRAKTKAEAQRAVTMAYARAAASLSSELKSPGAAAGGAGGASVSGGADGAEGAAAGGAALSANMDAGAAAVSTDAAPAADVSTPADASGAASAEAAGAVPSAEGASGANETAGAADADGAAAQGTAESGAAETEKDGEAASAPSTAPPNGGGEFEEPLLLIVMRHLQAAWMDFMHSKKYKDMPEDELQAAKRREYQAQAPQGVKAVSLTAVAASYQNAMHLDAAARAFADGGARR